VICYNLSEKGNEMGLKRRDNTELVLQTLDELKKPKKLTKEEKKAKSFLEKVEFARTESARLYNPDDYRIIRDEKELLEYIERGNKCGYISIDTETTGLEFTDTVVGLCLYVDGEKACYCPYRHIDYFTGELVENQLSKESIIQALSRITANIILHHADFDIRKILRTFGVRLKCWWDTQIGGYILNENESHKLKDLHGKYVSKQDEATFGDLFNKIGFQYVPIEVGYMYAAHDAIDTRELQQFQAKFLRVDHPREDFRNLYYVFRNIEMAVLDATINMEETGVYLDMPYTESIIPKYEEKLEKALEECYTELLPYKEQCLTHEQLDNPVNLSSPKQVAIVLYDIMKIKPIDGRKVGEEVLEKINIPFTKALLAYRGALKLLNTYIKKLPSVRQADDKIHCSFNATGTSTGRYSSSDPRLQNCELGSINSVNSGEL
jgi:DNA polymerase-1